MTLDGSTMQGMAAKDNMAYPISGTSVAVTLRFATNGSVSLLFVGSAFEKLYNLTIVSSPLDFKLNPPAATHIEVTVADQLQANVDLQFWVDFSSAKFIVGIGSDVLLTTDHTLTSISRMTITPDCSTIVTASVCSMRGRLALL